MAGWDWNDLLRNGVSALRGARNLLDSVSPPCDLCQQPAYIPVPCLFCGRIVCLEHGWFHRRAVTICAACMDSAFEQLSEHHWPFSIFGLEPPCTEHEVNKAFRQIGAVLVDGSGANKLPWLWNLVQQAKVDAINIVRNARAREAKNNG
jgi:hypothetical protein